MRASFVDGVLCGSPRVQERFSHSHWDTLQAPLRPLQDQLESEARVFTVALNVR